MKVIFALLLLIVPAYAQQPQPQCNGVSQAITVDPVVGWKCATLPIPPQKSDVYSAVNGFAYTVPNNVTIEVINGSTLLASGTITLPSAPTDGMPLTIESPKGVTLATVQANTGQVISGTAIAAFVANQPYRLKYSGVNSTWYPN